jgi:hypothetical protein
VAKPRALPLLLGARASVHPSDFAVADGDALHLGRTTMAIGPILLNGYVMVLNGTREKEDSEYGAGPARGVLRRPAQVSPLPHRSGQGAHEPAEDVRDRLAALGGVFCPGGTRVACRHEHVGRARAWRHV